MLTQTLPPVSLLFSKISAEMRFLGLSFSDASEEETFRAWLLTEWKAAGCTHDFVVLSQPASSTAFQMSVRGLAGYSVSFWWGDGTTDRYSITSADGFLTSHTYGSGALRPIVIIGKLIGVFSVSNFYCGGRALTNLSSLSSITLSSGNTVTGNICDAPRTITHMDLWGSNTIYGDIAELPPLLDYFLLLGANTTHGNIANLPTGVKYVIYGTVNSLTYNVTPGGRVWAEGMQGVTIYPNGTGFTSSMTDSLLIDLSNVATWTDGAVIDLRGNCAAPTSAADSAIDTLISAGVSVQTN